MNPAERVSEYLHWASKNHPLQSVAIELLVKVAYMMPQLPRATNSAIESFRKNGTMSRVKVLIRERHGCEIKYIRGVGYRATVDTNDIIDNVSPSYNRSIQGAIDRHAVMLSNLKLKEITGKERKASVSAWMEVNKRLKAPAISGKLLAPDFTKKDKDKKDKDKKDKKTK